MFLAMKSLPFRTLLECRLPLLLLLLLCGPGALTKEAVHKDPGTLSTLPCLERPDVVSEALVRSPAQLQPDAEVEIVNATADDVPAVVPIDSPAAIEDFNGPAEETTTSSTTTTTAATTTTSEATTTTSEATTTTSASMNLGIGASFSNVISGGAGGGAGGLLSVLGGTPRSTEKKGPTGNFDTYLDNILTNLGKSLRQNGFDPIPLGKMLQCRNCSLEGLSLIRRNGPSNLQYMNRTLIVDAHLQLPALYISCFPCVEVILMVPFTAMLEVALWDLQIYGKVRQPATRNAHPTLSEYRVLREGDLDVTLTGYGILGPVAEMGFKILHQRQVSEIIREFVYDKVPNFIEKKLQEFSFPIGK